MAPASRPDDCPECGAPGDRIVRDGGSLPHGEDMWSCGFCGASWSIAPAPLRVGVTGSRRYGSPARIRSAFLAACERARPHDGHVLVHGQCDPWHPDTNKPVPWHRAKRLSAEVQGRLLGGDWLAEWVALDMAARDGIAWEIERHPADWHPGGADFDRGAGFRRNSDMVNLGADEWQAFAVACADPCCRRTRLHPTHGTAHCADLAAKAGIPVYRFAA